mgnify:FL=1
MFYRSVLSVLLFVCMLASAKSQSFFDGFGVKGGINIADIYEGEDGVFSELTPKTYFHLGIYKNILLSNRWSVRPELLYTVKGAQTALDIGLPGQSMQQDARFRANYLSLPVLLQYAPSNFTIGAGLEPAYLLSEQFFLNDNKEDGELYDNNFDLGLVGNLSYTFLMVDVDLRYVFGLTPFNEQITSGSGDQDDKLRNGVLQLSLGLRIF